jgi:hypothetical protein
MTACIQSRISKHGNSTKRNAIQNGFAWSITATTAFPGITFLIHVKAGAMLVGIGYRANGLIWANRRTHAATNTHLIHFGILANADKMTILVATLLFEDIQFGHPLPAIGQVNSLLWADCRTLPA